MKMLVVCAVVMALLFGYMVMSSVRWVERSNDAVDMLMARSAR